MIGKGKRAMDIFSDSDNQEPNKRSLKVEPPTISHPRAFKNIITKMSCGHYYRTNKIRETIQAQLNEGNKEIVCQRIVEGQKCNKLWDLKECFETAQYSQKQWDQINLRLVLNATVNPNWRGSDAKFVKEFLKPITPTGHQSGSRSIKVRLIDESQKNIQIAKNSTVQQLKDLIFKDHYFELLPSQTVLCLDDAVLNKETPLSSLELKLSQTVRQKKAELWEIEQLNTNKNKQDEISCQTGVAIMSCGHQFGRKSMQALIKTKLSSLQSSIRCPYSNKNDSKCQCEWNKTDWRLVAGFTQSEMNEIQYQLSQNLVKSRTKKCPYCGTDVSRIELDTLIVSCSACHSPDFCFTCLSPWKNNRSSSCKSDICVTLKQKVEKAPRERKFTLYLKNGKKKIVMTPTFRACPRCRNIVENDAACKHTKCSCNNFENTFCFVCLSLCQNGKWPCGQYNQHCGFVAPNQRY